MRRVGRSAIVGGAGVRTVAPGFEPGDSRNLPKLQARFSGRQRRDSEVGEVLRVESRCRLCEPVARLSGLAIWGGRARPPAEAGGYGPQASFAGRCGALRRVIDFWATTRRS